MGREIVEFFISAFYFPGLSWTLILLAIAIGLLFGAIWLTPYWPPLRRRPGLWLVAVVGAFLTWAAIAFIQIPLQAWTGQALLHFWGLETLQSWILLAGIPQVLISGLVQEAAKLAPVVFYRWRNSENFTPRVGLIAGAMAGAGFGVFEAIWVHNTIFAAGWNWGLVEAYGFAGLLGFWERFFTIAFHISVSALAGYGLARGMGWQFYLVASFLHGAINFIILPLQSGLITAVQTEIIIAIFAVVLVAVTLWLRWRMPPADVISPDNTDKME